MAETTDIYFLPFLEATSLRSKVLAGLGPSEGASVPGLAPSFWWFADITQFLPWSSHDIPIVIAAPQTQLNNNNGNDINMCHGLNYITQQFILFKRISVYFYY